MTSNASAPPPRAVAGDRLSAAEVYAIWQIRDLVFAVEQRCDEPDVDGIDLLASTTHLWLADAQGLTSYLRSYAGNSGTRRIGRVCTRIDQRGRGLSGRLLTHALDLWGHERIDIGAQAYLEDWYTGYGFTRSGPGYEEAGIAHLPMTRLAARG
ncbi:MAG: GNAT family N-acetyltransferase [Aeromicrobium sp.]|uniref:GNAT family N-acetyltransferase n=1 Tax=Aeromicrobium sp. TaxID=1871063 RepID=UPI0039E63AB4